MTAPSYVITEDKSGQTGYCPRGAALTLWKSKHHEVILAGPAETGKTYACLQKLDALLWKYPGAQALMARKTYKSLCESAAKTYARKVLAPDCGVSPYGGDRPHWFTYPNGSRLTLGGLDDPGKVLSAEYDFVYVNQAEEIGADDWETLLTRATGRAGNAPYAQVFGDCNPGPPTHWILHRPALNVLQSVHQDNPTLYDGAGALTDQGRITMAVLDGLTGVRRERLRNGKWVQAEGVVYPGWDARRHLVNPFPVPDSWARIWSIDFGYTNPFVWHEWARDGDGRLYLVREIYHTRRLVEDHAARIRTLTAGSPSPEAIICDHDAEGRATLERHLQLCTTPATKTTSGQRLPGIQEVGEYLRDPGDGKPRLTVFRDALDERDPDLAAARRPTCTAEEFDCYVYDTRPGARGDVPLKENDHGMDALRYLVFYQASGATAWSFGASDPRESLTGRIPRGVGIDLNPNEDDDKWQ